MRWFKAAAAVLCITSVLLLGTNEAKADPVNGKNKMLLTLQCTVLGTLPIVTNANGNWTPGLVTTSNQVLKPYELHLTGTFTPTGGSPQAFTEDQVKSAPRNGRLDVCTFSDSGSDAEGTFSLTGTVNVSYTPAH